MCDMKSAIPVVVTIDSNYLQPAGVMLNSLLSNTSAPIAVYLLHADLTPADQARLDKVIDQFSHASISYLQIGDEPFAELKVTGHFSPVMYYKLCFDTLLPASVEKGIYLDPDVVVLADIEELWQFDMGDALLAATPLKVAQDRDPIVKAGEPYFSCGVMLVDLEKWRACKLGSKLMQTAAELAEHYDRCPEMDVLNVVTREQWCPLPVYWNYWKELLEQRDFYPADDLERARRDDGILHFPGPVKPWHFAYSKPNQKLYAKYRAGTPWEYAPLESATLSARIYRKLPPWLIRVIEKRLAGSRVGNFLRRNVIGRRR
jgi:lipopolysaccharide biosynthesis glycosyltransferase